MSAFGGRATIGRAGLLLRYAVCRRESHPEKELFTINRVFLRCFGLQAQDSLWLAMQGDPILRRAVERAGVQKLTSGAVAHYKELVETAGAHVAAHPD